MGLRVHRVHLAQERRRIPRLAEVVRQRPLAQR